MGTSVIESKSLSPTTIATLSLLFALSLPIGAIVGICINNGVDEGEEHSSVTGSLNAIAAGSLLYIGIVEMIAEEFEDHHHNKSAALKATMFGALLLGCTIMSLLALWA